VTAAPLIAVLDYGIGNLRSAQKALQRVGADARLTVSAVDAQNADAVVLPGVGAFGACMNALRHAGLEEVVHDAVDSGKPFLGICVGMQMLFTSSQESDDVDGLDIISGEVTWIPNSLPRPQMQWNQLTITTSDPMFDGLGVEPWMYFVHSLHGVPADASDVVATTRYGIDLNVAFRKDNVFATQFHPEKSAASGLHLLKNFITQVEAA
jgi:imidazole glycerol-phosphate synthase subunit HisH